ncbi:hypothetical protein IHE55_11420 [Streptomyces pactum]|uniref:Uncharacterized protein n=1 Tax=Streptomyces pactum TaxID=68249 RepID=A0ABS0NJN7_9ACTN|nr:hypothetical protein [Streptomyces pactum]MBH5335371.1 hypothetical protein [Streptomyces pactum]
MAPADGAAQAGYAEAAADLARRVLDALGGVGDTAPLAAWADGCADAKAALAAVRVLGPDVLAPQALTGTAADPRDAAVIAQSADVFPAPVFAPPPPEGPAEDWIMAWRDRATATLLARHAGSAPQVPEPAVGDVLTDARPWQRWSVLMAQLAPLGLPGVDGPVVDAARRNPLALARGTTRAMLRRDYPTAARLVRWLAALHHDGIGLPLEPLPVADHIALHAGTGPRTALDLAVARRLLGAGPGPGDRGPEDGTPDQGPGTAGGRT